MATSTTQKPPGSQRSKLLRLIVIVLIVLIVLVGLTVLIIWLTIKPKKLVYTIEDGSIHNYHLSNNNHLNATYNFILQAYNPNKKMSVYYDNVEIAVLYDHETVARGTINPFYQHKRNTTRFKLALASYDVGLPGHVSLGLKVERTLNHVSLDVKLKARIRFKVGGWKSRHYHMKVSCEDVIVHFSSSSKGFQRIKCDVDI